MRPLFLVFLLAVAAPIFAQNTAARTKHFNLENGLAVQGYDLVAYFAGKAMKGSAKYATTYQGVRYQFASEANKNQFLQNPTQYEPQYGGWCAFAMGDYDKKVEINPETFKIVGGKLYLFYNAYFMNTLKSWNKNEKNLKPQADTNWAKIINQ
jgi:YHS domain-containing protein